MFCELIETRKHQKMNTVQALSASHFRIDNGVLKLQYSEPYVVVFHAMSSPKASKISEQTLGLVKEVAGKGYNFVYGTVDVVEHVDVYYMSTRSKTPIENIPFILIFFQHTPVLKYVGRRTTVDLSQFLYESATYLSSLGSPTPPSATTRTVTPAHETTSHTPAAPAPSPSTSSANDDFLTCPGNGSNNCYFDYKYAYN